MAHNFRSLVHQRNLIKDNMALELKLSQRWEPIPIGWFNEWKKYVDFDSTAHVDNRAQEDIDALHPGGIDSSPLLGNFGDELSRNASSDVDYVLLLHATVTQLFDFYGSPKKEVRFPRWTRNAGTLDQPKIYIKLYPSRIEVSGWNSKTEEIEKYKKFFYIFDQMSLKEMKKELAEHKFVEFYDDLDGKFRIWYKLKEITTVETVEREEGALRYVTKDSTSIVDGWKLLHTGNDVNFELLLSDRACVELMIEKSHIVRCPEQSWPRYKFMNAWKQDLGPGDVIDVFRSNDKKWLEAIVKSADEEGVEVHYKSFEASDDEKIPKAHFDTKLAPLQTYTVNWKSAIEEDDLCDIKIRGVWVQGSIESIDTANNKVQVCYNDALVDHYNSQPAQGAVEGPAQAVDNSSSVALSSNNSMSNDVESMVTNDDDKKNMDEDRSWLKTTVNNVTSMVWPKQKPKPPLELIKEPVVDSIVVAAWFSLDAEDIAYIQTHSRMTHRSRKYLVAKSEKKVSYYDYGDRASKGVPVAAGCVGLQNIGNTCYMNSMLQCLSHAGPLAEIFTSGRYRADLNRENAIGFGGRLAKSYAQLMKDMYSNNFTTLVPRQFKTTIGQCWNQFANYDQQDSQELMGYLIDGLHEDLNRVQKKPYVQTIRGNGRPDSLVSADSWRRHLLRHDSAVNDIMYGQTKSTVTCGNPSCKKQHVTFEAFNSLSIPVPEDSSLQLMRVLVRLLPYDSTPFEVDVQFNVKSGRTNMLKQAVVQRLIDMNCFTADEAPKLFFQLYTNSIGYNSYDYQKGSERLQYFNPKIDRCILMQTESDGLPRDLYREYDTRAYKWDYIYPQNFSGRLSALLFSSKRRANAHYQDEIEHLELPVVLSYDTVTTGRQIHRMVQEYARKFVPSDFNMDELQNAYEIYYCTRFYRSDQILDDEKLFDPGFSQSLAVVWKKEFEPTPKTQKFELRGEPVENASESAGGLSIFKCFEKFLEHEQLPEIETYYCNACKQHLAPQKKFDIWASPDVLALHLKRFTYSTSQYGNVIREKISDHVEYPIRGLDLGRFMVGPIDPEAPPIYDLVGVSLHSGTLYGGHYTAYCKDEASGNFYNFNDSHVGRVDERTVVSDQAYVLIYRRRNGSLRWGGIKPTEGGDILPDDP